VSNRATQPARPTLDQYVGHAERFGSELIFQTAVELNVPPRDLGHLARHLRRVDRRWRLSPADRHNLAELLVAGGAKTATVVEQAGVSRSTVAGLRAAGRGLVVAPPRSREPCRLIGTESRGSASESTTAKRGRVDSEESAAV
jgi:hypothetical protein